MPFDGVETDMRRKVLLRALELIEKGWTRGALARDRHGHQCGCNSPEAVRWCARGAIHRARRDLGVEHLVVIHGFGIEDFNDRSPSKHSVIAALCLLMEGIDYQEVLG